MQNFVVPFIILCWILVLWSIVKSLRYLVPNTLSTSSNYSWVVLHVLKINIYFLLGINRLRYLYVTTLATSAFLALKSYWLCVLFTKTPSNVYILLNSNPRSISNISWLANNVHMLDVTKDSISGKRNTDLTFQFYLSMNYHC